MIAPRSFRIKFETDQYILTNLLNSLIQWLLSDAIDEQSNQDQIKRPFAYDLIMSSRFEVFAVMPAGNSTKCKLNRKNDLISPRPFSAKGQVNNEPSAVSR